MEYDAALSKAWTQLNSVTKDEKFSARLLTDEYEINLQKQEVVCLSSRAPAQNYAAILLLHYITRKIKGLPSIQGEWISFKELDGGIPYYAAFKKRVINPLLKKYGSEPEHFLEISRKFKSEKLEMGDGDASVVFEVLDGVPMLITFWRADAEFGPEANVLFDKSIKDIFCTEDVVVLSAFVVSNIK